MIHDIQKKMEVVISQLVSSHGEELSTTDNLSLPTKQTVQIVEFHVCLKSELVKMESFHETKHLPMNHVLLEIFQLLQQVLQHPTLLQHKFNGIGEKYHE